MKDTNERHRILEVLGKARAEIERLKGPKDQRIAVVGMAGRFPGAESVSDFWKMLRNGICGIQDISETELFEAGVPRSQFQQPEYVRRYASFERPTYFDASFFGYAPGEADVLDPQHRVFLECAWTALEDAGYDPSQYDGRIGVYGGAALNNYLVNLHNDRKTRESVNPVQAVVSNVMGLMPARVSYHLDLKGPSCGVQTGCSTSLVAVHNACRSLLDGECEMALAGGVTIGEPKPVGYLFEESGIASPDGLCRAFDAEGKGTVFGNGVGIVVLKRLEAARKDGDAIRAVLLGSAINNDGLDKVGLLAPSVNGQAEAIRLAVQRAGISPASISYVEAHGTATELGDPVEFMALGQAIGEGLQQEGACCRIGSVKTNVGHLDAAAGVAGLIKVVLSLQHKTLPPSLNFSRANPQIDFESCPFEVNDSLTHWPNKSGPRRAGVSSFGMGGTNAHIILEEAPPQDVSEVGEREWFILPLSAKTEPGLVERQSLLATDLEDQSLSLSEVAYTLQVGRQSMKHRSVVVCKSREAGLKGGKGNFVDGSGTPVFLFSGQGSQYAGMTRQLYEREAKFREGIDTCAAILAEDWDLKAWLYGDADAGELKKTENAQPALFAVEYALAQLLRDWGIQPVAMMGHSLGEYVAACVAGVFELEDALQLVRYRGVVMQHCQPGAMLAVAEDVDGVRSFLNEQVSVAASNGPKQTVVSGPFEAIEAVENRLKEAGITAQCLETSHAFHSAMMEPALEPFRQHLSQLSLKPPMIDIVSNQTGKWLTADEVTSPDYWVDQLRHPVLFAEGVKTLGEIPNPVFLEVGPGYTLCRLVASQLGANTPALTTMPGGFDIRSDEEVLMNAIGDAWLNGVCIDWKRLHSPGQCRVALSTYPFERTEHYVSPNRDEPKEVTEGQFYVPGWRIQRASIGSKLSDETLVIFGQSPGLEIKGISALRVESEEDVRQLIQDRGIAEIRWLFVAGPDSRSNFDRLLHLAQTWQQNAERATLRLDVLTSGFFDSREMGVASILGLLRVLPHELSGAQCRILDGDWSSTECHVHLKHELQTPFVQGQDVIAYYGRRRLVRCFEPAALSAEHTEVLTKDAIYFVVGDMVDGLGLVYARALRQHLNAKVLLVGREGLPVPGEWDTWLATHGNQHPRSQLIQKVKALGREGEDFAMTSASLESKSKLLAAMKDLLNRTGSSRVQGVFYCDVMGGESSCALAELTTEDCDRILGHKIAVADAVASAVEVLKPGFALVQSSLSSIVGGRGFAAYAAANSHLDLFAEQQGMVGINWDACQLDDDEGSGGSNLMVDALSPDAVWEATRRVLANPAFSQVVVSPRPLRARLESTEAFVPSPSNDEPGRTRPGLNTEYVAPRTPVEAAVAKAMGDLLGISGVGIHDNFFALGGHSLLAIQAITKLRKKFEVEIPMRAILQGTPTVAGIAAVIEENLPTLTQDDASVVEDLLDKIDAESL